MAMVKTLSQYWLKIQSSLFPWLEEQLGELTEKEQKTVTTLELIRIERFTAFSRSLYGRPPKERAAIARAFVAKAVYNMPTMRYWTVWHVTRSCGASVAGNRKVKYQAKRHSQGPLPSFPRANYRRVSIRQ
jgi:hypothetical protein